MDYVVMFLFLASVSGSKVTDHWLKNYVCLHFMLCKSQFAPRGLSGTASTGSPSVGSATERSSLEFTAPLVPMSINSQSRLPLSTFITSYLETSTADPGSGTIDTPDLVSSSSVPKSLSDSLSHLISSQEFTAPLVPMTSNSQPWLPLSTFITSYLETSTADPGSGTIDTPDLASSSSVAESLSDSLSHLISSQEFTENSIHEDPERSTLQELSTLIAPHLETSTHIKQSSVPILETSFETLSDSYATADPGEDTGGYDTLVYVDHSLISTPEDTVMDKTNVPVHPYTSSIFPLIQSSHTSIEYTAAISPWSMSSVQSNEIPPTTQFAKMEMPATSAEYITTASSSILQIATSSIHHKDLSADENTTPRNAFPVRVVKKVCRCSCRNIPRLDVITSEAVVAMKVLIQSELLVDKANLSSLIQRKVSTPDVRTSASGIGYLGLVLLSLPFLIIVLSDAKNMITLLFSAFKTLRQ